MRVAYLDASVRFYTEILGFRKGIAWGEGDSRTLQVGRVAVRIGQSVG